MGKFKVVKEVPEDRFAAAYNVELGKAVENWYKLHTEEGKDEIDEIDDALTQIIKKDGMVILPMDRPMTLKQMKRGENIPMWVDSVRSGIVTSFLFSSLDQFKKYEPALSAYPVMMPIKWFLGIVFETPEINEFVIDPVLGREAIAFTAEHGMDLLRKADGYFLG